MIMNEREELKRLGLHFSAIIPSVIITGHLFVGKVCIRAKKCCSLPLLK